MNSPFIHLCGARLRGKPGQTCRAPALRGQTRCRLHAGRPKGSVTPEGRAATRAGHAAYYAKYRAAKARGEPVRPSGGRKKRWLIPRWWRLKLSDAEQAAVLAHMAEYDRRVRGGQTRPSWQATSSTSIEARSLESCERALILAMNRPDPPPLKTIEQVYTDVRAAEAMFGDAGSEVRLRRLAWEVDRFRRARTENRASKASRVEAGASVERASQRELLATTPDTEPPDSVRDAISLPPVESIDRFRTKIDDRKRRLRQFNLAESATRQLDSKLATAGSEAAQLAVLDRWLADIERAAERTEAMFGHFIRAAEARAARPLLQPERPHSIAPWLRRP